jgi:hypothetical protein
VGGDTFNRARRGGFVIQRILFTGDFLRPGDTPLSGTPGLSPPRFRSSQTENVIWLYRLLGRKLAEATELPVEIKTWSRGIDTPAIYQALGLTEDTEGWIKAFSAPQFNRPVMNRLEAIFHGSLVIAFEMADSIKLALSQLGIPFIDLNIHPVRFLPDVFFAAQTNHQAVFEAMRPYHTPGETYFDWADLLAAAAIKRPHIPIAPGTALLVGQTRVDRSLIIGGQLRGLPDYADTLRELLSPGQPLLFKPHPYNAAGASLHGAPFDAMTTASANIYTLLPQEHLHHVIGVSSSVLVEARYFGKQVTALSALPFDIPDTAEQATHGQHLSLYDCCFSTDFWRDILAPLVPTSASTGHRFHRPANTLRLSLGNFWGFNEVSTDFLVQLYRDNPKAG